MSEKTISMFLVDDVPELRELMRWGLEEDSGFKVVGEAGDGRSGVKGIAETRPDAVLLDLSMPDMDGRDAIPLIRSEVPHAAIIVLSGFAADRMRASALDRGADGFVEKGGPLEDLREAVRRAVEQRRATAET